MKHAAGQTVFVVVLAMLGASVAQAAPQGSRARDREVHGTRSEAIPAFDPAQFATSYRQALGRLAAGDREDAVRELTALESHYVSPELGTRELWKTQAAIIRQLTEGQPELLLPVIMLHHDASRSYRNRKIWFLANHSRQVASALARVYAKQAETRGSQVDAGRALASLGGLLQEDMSSTFCRCTDLYDQALELDPSNEAALLGEATVYEKVGDYEQAVTYLQRLVDQRPRNLEARLRLAINIGRTRGDQHAEPLLRELTETQGDDWPLVLAYEELANIYLRSGAYDQADQLLAVGRKRFPQEQRLLVQHALVLERSRKPAAAAALLAELDRLPPQAGTSPRMLYNRWPQQLMRQIQTELWQSADSRLPLLREALESQR